MTPFLTQPPNPDPRRPRLTCPPGAWDTHIHLFGPASRFDFDPQSPYRSADALPETYLELQARLGLSKAVIVSAGGYGRDTRHLLDVLERFPRRFVGVALPPEDLSDDEIERMHRLGVRGVCFVSANRWSFLPPIMPELAARVAERGWHVQFHPSGTDLPDYEDALMKLPSDIVIDHFGNAPTSGGIDQPAFKALLRMLESGRVWVKMSGPMRCTKQEFPYSEIVPYARELVRHAPDRVVWGSDWPHVNMNDRFMPNDGDLFDLLADWVPDEKARHKILVENPEALYGDPS